MASKDANDNFLLEIKANNGTSGKPIKLAKLLDTVPERSKPSLYLLPAANAAYGYQLLLYPNKGDLDSSSVKVIKAIGDNLRNKDDLDLEIKGKPIRAFQITPIQPH